MRTVFFAILKNQFERKLFAWSVVALACLCAVKVKFKATDFMEAELPKAVLFFQAKPFEDWSLGSRPLLAVRCRSLRIGNSIETLEDQGRLFEMQRASAIKRPELPRCQVLSAGGAKWAVLTDLVPLAVSAHPAAGKI